MKISRPTIRAGILLLLSFYSVSCIAQTKEKGNNSIVKLNLSSGFDPFAFPVIQLSYEKRLTKRFSVAGEFGYQFYQFSDPQVDTSDYYKHSFFSTNSDTSFVSPKGIKANVEFRYYFFRHSRSKNAKLKIYGATSFFYRYNKTDIAIIYFQDSILPAVDCYWMKRNDWGVMQVFGLQFIIKKIVLEFYAGIGYSNRTVFNYNREYNIATDRITTNIHGFGAEEKFLSDYNGETAAMSLGVRLGLAF